MYSYKKKCFLYASKTEINKNKTQIHTTRSSPFSDCPLVGRGP